MVEEKFDGKVYFICINVNITICLTMCYFSFYFTHISVYHVDKFASVVIGSSMGLECAITCYENLFQK